MMSRWVLRAASLVVAALLVAACGPEDARDPAGADLDSAHSAFTQQVEPGDVLVSINGRPVASRAEALEVMKSTSEGGSLCKVVIVRRGQRIELDLGPTR